MNRSCLLCVAIAVVFAAGCASIEPNTAEPQSEKRYVTGSRLPAREGNTTTEVTSISNRDDIDNMRGGAIEAPSKPGGK